MFRKTRLAMLSTLAMLSLGGTMGSGMTAGDGQTTIDRTMRAQVTFPDRTDDSEVKSGTKVQGLYTMDMSGGPSSVSYRFNADRIETAYGSGYDGSYDYLEAVFEGTGLDSLWDRVAEVFLEGNLADIPYDIAKGSGKVTLTFQADRFPDDDSFAGLFAESVPMASAFWASPSRCSAPRRRRQSTRRRPSAPTRSRSPRRTSTGRRRHAT